MAKYIGVDWASKGWFAVILYDDTEPDTGFYPSIFNLWHHNDDADLILIDIPIGLRENGKRACDIEAKTKLSPQRGSSVFNTPIRDAVEARNLKKAKEEQEHLDFGVQNQAWSLVPRVKEVDEFLEIHQEEISKGQIRETHPEICFWAFNDGDPMDHKKSAEDGIEERKCVLSSIESSAIDLYRRSLGMYTEPEYAPVIGKSSKDDILDAMIAAYTAREGFGELQTLPQERSPEQDPKHDRPIEICYHPIVK